MVTSCSEETSVSTSGTSVQTDQELGYDTSGSPTPNWDHSAVCAKSPGGTRIELLHLQASGNNGDEQMM